MKKAVLSQRNLTIQQLFVAV